MTNKQKQEYYAAARKAYCEECKMLFKWKYPDHVAGKIKGTKS